MRPQDWPALLDGYIGAARAKPFVWGEHDCVSFTSGWARLMNGSDAFAPFAGQYDSEQSAFRIMHGHGVRTMEDAGDYLFGKTARKDVEHVNRGDIVLAENALGICIGVKVACLMRDGMRFVLFNKFQTAWSV